jgi:hypothetical protein
MQLTVIRDKHEGTVNMVAGHAKNKSGLDTTGITVTDGD